MYVHISASPEKFLKQVPSEKVSRNGTLTTYAQKSRIRKGGRRAVIYP